jgi:multicomponent Na+:H+ antiporter subunit C
MTADFIVAHYPYVLIATLLGVGLYGMTMKRNLLKKVIGMTIFQTSIYLLFIQGATKQGATIPVLLRPSWAPRPGST